MRLLWFEVTTPSGYINERMPIAGWQDALERIVLTIPNIELIIAFVSEKYSEPKVSDCVTYVPIWLKRKLHERIFNAHWDLYVKKVLPVARQIVEEYHPDLIQIFGVEWPLGQIALYTSIPVVVHIQGAMLPYVNAEYPPGYSYWDALLRNWRKPMKLLWLWNNKQSRNNSVHWERKTWTLVDNYMGRTQWDYSLSRVMHPGRRYFHVEEALRPIFLSTGLRWILSQNGRLRLVTIGCGSFWKGPDMILKVAQVLTSLGVDFEWNVVGKMRDDVKWLVESKEEMKFEDYHVNILGIKQPEELVELLCSSTMYVHTAYIENSPNSICEAQCLGVPIVSTNVGGISSLVRNDVDGILVAANDPWQMADAIIELSSDNERMLRYSENTRQFARIRHDEENIKKQLLNCYYSLLSNH